jgi:23S rRNA (pseudouridine1915-N3)-methyltransferase
MQGITIICPSSLVKDGLTLSLLKEYEKRITAKVTFIDVSVKLSKNDPPAVVKQKQGLAMLDASKKLPSNSYLIVMDEHGKIFDSPTFAKNIENMSVEGYSHCAFFIGGAHGLSEDVLNHVHLKLSFGAMVWPHRLVAIMLLEQFYRAETIIAGHPYHKA